jgi:hypothetical protein
MLRHWTVSKHLQELFASIVADPDCPLATKLQRANDVCRAYDMIQSQLCITAAWSMILRNCPFEQCLLGEIHTQLDWLASSSHCSQRRGAFTNSPRTACTQSRTQQCRKKKFGLRLSGQSTQLICKPWVRERHGDIIQSIPVRDFAKTGWF